MTSFFIRFLVIIVLLWVLRRVLASVFGDGRQRSGTRRPPDVPPKPSSKMVKDPVCGMYMDPRLAVELQNREGQFYFCSKECRQKFLAKS